VILGHQQPVVGQQLHVQGKVEAVYLPEHLILAVHFQHPTQVEQHDEGEAQQPRRLLQAGQVHLVLMARPPGAPGVAALLLLLGLGAQRHRRRVETLRQAIEDVLRLPSLGARQLL